MTPKEKAYDLMIKYFKISYCNDTRERHYNAKECALIAVDEILDITKQESPSTYVYYMKVKQEIEAL